MERATLRRKPEEVRQIPKVTAARVPAVGLLAYFSRTTKGSRVKSELSGFSL